MVCEKILLLHFKSGKISVIIFLGPLLMELHFLFMNGYYFTVSIDMITMITNDKYDKYVHTTFSINMITIDIIMYLRYI